MLVETHYMVVGINHSYQFKGIRKETLIYFDSLRFSQMPLCSPVFLVRKERFKDSLHGSYI